MHSLKSGPLPVDAAKKIESTLSRSIDFASLFIWTATPPRRLHMTDYRVAKGEAQEDQITASIEKYTSQVPSSVYLALALGSMAISVGFQAAKKQHESLFIGQWAAPFLILGIYNKLVKIHGSDAASSQLNNGS
jgi:hypothetical protein